MKDCGRRLWPGKRPRCASKKEEKTPIPDIEPVESFYEYVYVKRGLDVNLVPRV